MVNQLGGKHHHVIILTMTVNDTKHVKYCVLTFIKLRQNLSTTDNIKKIFKHATVMTVYKYNLGLQVQPISYRIPLDRYCYVHTEKQKSCHNAHESKHNLSSQNIKMVHLCTFQSHIRCHEITHTISWLIPGTRKLT